MDGTRNVSSPIIQFNPNVSVDISKIEDDCFFKVVNGTSAYQVVSVQSFSHLIDLDLAMFNISALIGSKNLKKNDKMIFSVHFSQNKNTYDYRNSISSKHF